MSDKLQKLQELIAIATEGLTRGEFLKAFSDVIEFVKKIEKNLATKIDDKTASAEAALFDLNKIYQQTIKKVEEENTASLSNVKRWALEEVGKLFIKSQLNEKIKKVDEKLSELEKLKWPDSETITNQAAEQAKKLLEPLLPKMPNFGEKIIESREYVRDGLEMLEGAEKLKIDAIYNLREELDEIKKMLVNKNIIMGGSVQAQSVTDRSTDGTLVGSINGSNTIFTLRQSVGADKAKVFVNGSRMDLTNDYTLSGATLTFVTAPPTGSNILVDY